MAHASVAALKRQLRHMASEAVARQSRRFFKTGKGEYGEGDQFLGIRVPALRKLVKAYADLTVTEMAELLRSAFHEERQLALFMLTARFQKSGSEDQKQIYSLYLKNTAYVNSWDLVDGSAPHIVGAYLMDRDRAPVHRLARSKDLWERRIAILSTFYYIQRHEFDDTLRVSERLLTDREDLIHKAVGWMLREIGKRDTSIEETFLKKHHRHMPRTMLRYAIERFPKAKRLAYLKGDI